LAEAVVRDCSGVAVLATSREPLDVDGELLRPVGSLTLPDAPASFDELAEVASVRLFVERAQAVRPEFVLDPVSAPVVADICRQLDGVPLAIELAAARVASLSINEIGRRLDQRFRLLTGGRRTARERLEAAGESDAVRRRHAEYYVALAEAAEVGLKGRDEQASLRTLDVEHANLRAALDWSVAAGDADLALRLPIALGSFGITHY